MNLSPTVRHYLISLVAGALLAAGADGVVYLTSGVPFSWPLLGAAALGGVVMFGRDWLHNNTNAFLEGTAPAVVAAGVPVALAEAKVIDLASPPTPGGTP